MLKSRQIRLLKELTDNQDRYLSSKELSKRLNVSDKTIQADIKVLDLALHDYSTIITSKTGYGYQITIGDSKKFEYFLSEANDSIICRNFSDTTSRVTHILYRFFNVKGFIRKDMLLNELFVSESRMTKDLNIVRETLAKYDLKIIVKPKYGMYIEGSEKNKRRCILNERVNIDIFLNDEEELIKKVGDIVVDILTNSHYKVSDVVVQNLIIHIMYVIKRMKQDHYLDIIGDVDNELYYAHEYELAQKIMEQLVITFDIHSTENEITNLAIHLKGKRSYDEDTIDEDIDEVTTEIFKEINEMVHINFMNQVENRIALSLHVIALINRAKYHYSIKNDLNDEIKLNCPLAFDLAVISAKKISEKYNVEVVEGELGFLAVHFSKALEDINASKQSKNVLIISSTRKGETLLIRHNFLKIFSDYVDQLNIVSFIELNTIDVDLYDLIFTTYDKVDGMPEKTIKINYFMDTKDINTIKYALLDHEVKVEQFYNENLFIHFEEKLTKEEILKQLCKQTENYNPCDDNLYESVLRREEFGFTAFGNYVALPHPDHLISEKTSISVGILDYPVTWMKGRNVRIVLLLCGAKNKENHLSILFDKISNLIKDKDAVQQLLKQPIFDTFSKLLEKY